MFPSFENEHNLILLIIYSLIIIIWLSLLNDIKRPDIKIIINNKYIILLIKALALLSSLSFLYLFPYAVKSIKEGGGLLKAGGVQILPNSIFTTIFVFPSVFYMFIISALFIAIIKKEKKIYIILLFLGSITNILVSICNGGRDGIIWTILGYIWNIWIFYIYIEKKTLKVLRIYLPIIMVLLAILFIYITVPRFIESKDGIIENGFIGYLGQQPYVFCEAVNNPIESYTSNRISFYLFYKLFYRENNNIVNILLERKNPIEWMFGTFLTSLFIWKGWIGLITITIVTWIVMKIILKNHIYNNQIYQFIIISIFAQFMSEGIFYFRMWGTSGNIIIIIFILTVSLSLRKIAIGLGEKNRRRFVKRCHI